MGKEEPRGAKAQEVSIKAPEPPVKKCKTNEELAIECMNAMQHMSKHPNIAGEIFYKFVLSVRDGSIGCER